MFGHRLPIKPVDRMCSLYSLNVALVCTLLEFVHDFSCFPPVDRVGVLDGLFVIDSTEPLFIECGNLVEVERGAFATS